MFAYKEEIFFVTKTSDANSNQCTLIHWDICGEGHRAIILELMLYSLLYCIRYVIWSQSLRLTWT